MKRRLCGGRLPDESETAQNIDFPILIVQSRRNDVFLDKTLNLYSVQSSRSIENPRVLCYHKKMLIRYI